MNEQEALYYTLKGVMSELPEEKQKEFKGIYDEIKAILLKHGEESLLPLGLIGFEVQQDDFFKEVTG